MSKKPNRYAGYTAARMVYEDALAWAKQHGVVLQERKCEFLSEGNGARILLSQDMHVFKAALGVNKGHWSRGAWLPRPVCIVNMVIPAGETIVVCKTGGGDLHKCRATKAIVHSIVNRETHRKLKAARSGHRSDFEYVVGEVMPDENFDTHIRACSTGIHFYVDVVSAFEHFASM